MITFTTPIPRAAETTSTLVSFWADAEEQKAQAIYSVRENGAETRRVKVVFHNTDTDADYTFSDLIANTAEVRDLKKGMEDGAVGWMGLFNGTVT